MEFRGTRYFTSELRLHINGLSTFVCDWPGEFHGKAPSSACRLLTLSANGSSLGLPNALIGNSCTRLRLRE